MILIESHDEDEMAREHCDECHKPCAALVMFSISLGDSSLICGPCMTIALALINRPKPSEDHA